MEKSQTSNVLHYFYQICAIPRESGNSKKIKEYLVDFAIENKLCYHADEFDNVIIYKKNCNKEPIILQAHTDMVCVKTQKSNFDFRKDGIQTKINGNYMHAVSTSLGADDGIGMALILDVLANKKLKCNVEAVFTSDEETTMKGAYNIDVSKLSSKKLICLDGFESGTILTNCASFSDCYVSFSESKSVCSYKKFYTIKLGGLIGGHSGKDILKSESSHKLLADFLFGLDCVELCAFYGGHNYNVISSESTCVIATDLEENAIKEMAELFVNKKNIHGLFVDVKSGIEQKKCVCGNDFLCFVNEFLNGALECDSDGNVTDSQNISEVSLEDGYMKIGLRCGNDESIKKYQKNLKLLCEKFKFSLNVLDTQPSFNSFDSSSLVEKLVETAPNLVRKTKMHIAVECGIFQKRINNLDAVIISPTILNAHSTSERLNLKSVDFTSRWLYNFFGKI